MLCYNLVLEEETNCISSWVMCNIIQAWNPFWDLNCRFTEHGKFVPVWSWADMSSQWCDWDTAEHRLDREWTQMKQNGAGNFWHGLCELVKASHISPCALAVTGQGKCKAEELRCHVPLIEVIHNPGLQERHWERCPKLWVYHCLLLKA